MQAWLKSNVITLVVLVVSVAGNWAVNQSRLDTLEEQVNKNTASIEALRTSDNDVRISLARIQTDLEYIKAAISRLIP